MGEKEAMNDGWDILGTSDGVVEYKNIMLKGEKK